MRTPIAGALLAGMLLAACAGPTAPHSEFAVAVSTANSVLHLSNRGNVPIGFFPIESGTLALVDWVPCAGGPGCPVIRPGADTTVAYSHVAGYHTGAREGVVYWWALLPAPFPNTGFVVDTVHAVHFVF